MKVAGVVLLVLLAFIFSCGSTVIEGRKINTSKLREMIKGQTKAENVVRSFGQPARIEKMPSGEQKYLYHYYKEEYTYWWTVPRLETQKVEIVLKEGVVQDYRYSTQLRDVITDEDK